MLLSWNDIRERAPRFSHRWKGAESEDADAQRVAFLFTRYPHMTSLFGATDVHSSAAA
jgi:hypothetical protein